MLTTFSNNLHNYVVDKIKIDQKVTIPAVNRIIKIPQTWIQSNQEQLQVS